MNTTRNKLVFLDILFLSVIIISVIICTCFSGKMQTYIPFSHSDETNFSNSWLSSYDKPISLTKLSSLDKQENGSITVHKSLPNPVSPNACLNFRSKNITFYVSIDGEKIYSFVPSKCFISGKSYGNAFHSIPIPTDDSGKTISITATCLYNDNSCFFNMMTLEDSGTYVHHFFVTHSTQFIICLFTIIIGFILFIISISNRKFKLQKMSFFYLSLFAIGIGFWSAIETLFFQMLIGNSNFLHGMNYLILIFIPYPAILFVNSLISNSKKYYKVISFSLTMLVFIVCLILNAFDILDFHQCLPIIHSLIIISSVFVIYLFINNHLYCKKNNIPHKNILIIIAFSSVVIFELLDLLLYALSDKASSDTGFFLRIGILLCICLLAINSIIELQKKMKLANQTEILRKLAYTDALTGMKNRAAFLVKELDLENKLADNTVKEVLICQLDINNLKYVNDTFGHAYGDQHIKAAAYAITTAFKDKGDCFRIGGDEFTVFISQNNAEAIFTECLSVLQEEETKYNTRSDVKFKLAIAYGKSICTSGNAENIEKIEQIADKQMYMTKEHMKE